MPTAQKTLSFEEQINELQSLNRRIQSLPSLSDKLDILNRNQKVTQFLKSAPSLSHFLKEASPSTQLVIKAVLTIGQGPNLFQNIESIEHAEKRLEDLAEKLLDIEDFYSGIGGIIGYQLTMLKLINSSEKHEEDNDVSYHHPEGLDISSDSAQVRQAVRWGVEALRQVGEIYPLGGAGDRLNLKDEDTGELLPAAQLLFCGRTLLEWLIRDLQGREFLYYKLHGKQVFTPLAVMTSHEKNNHERMLNLCEKSEWFGRPKDSFRFFIQPLVPMITADGDWVSCAPLQPVLKPGGHGVIWKAALNEGIFDWFEQQQRKKVIVRQINNPVAGTDNGLLAFAGIGCHENKGFGFASCRRLLGVPEGMNVLKEVKRTEGYEYAITNVEYTEFKRCGVHDAPDKQGSPYSRFPSNTNILFGDLEAIRKALKKCPIPGMIVNMKSRVLCHGIEGKVLEKQAGRLESTMQNIADYIVDQSSSKLTKDKHKNLQTFLTYNERKKTISVVKQTYAPDQPLQGTPEGCFFDLLKNYRDLLINHCKMELPSEQSEAAYLSEGPNLIVLFHPALGMLYSVIGQKIRGGRLAEGAEWIMEIAEADISNLDLTGSLIIEADAVMGKKDRRGFVAYDNDYCGKCSLINVKVVNEGREVGKNAWQGQISRKEALRVTLHGNAEFFAQDVELIGDVHFEVPSGHRLVVYPQGKEIAWHFEKISQATWSWDYSFDQEDRIRLEKVKPTNK